MIYNIIGNSPILGANENSALQMHASHFASVVYCVSTEMKEEVERASENNSPNQKRKHSITISPM